MSLATLVTLSLVVAAPSPREGPAEDAAAVSPGGVAVGPSGPIPAHELWRDYVRVEPPKQRGHALLIAAGATFGVGALFQLGDLAICGNCATGVLERVFIGPAMILAPIGGFMRGRHDAYMDAAIGRRRRRTTAPIAAGLTMAAIGAIGGLANEVLWWQCAAGETGPYYTQAPINTIPNGPECRTTLARLALDGSALLVSSGLALGVWGIKVRRDARAYERAAIAVLPRLRAGELGLGVMGRF